MPTSKSLENVNKISINCTYQTAENTRDTYQLSPTAFLADVELNLEGEILSWTGSLLINIIQHAFIQKSDVSGEWLTLKGT